MKSTTLDILYKFKKTRFYIEYSDEVLHLHSLFDYNTESDIIQIYQSSLINQDLVDNIYYDISHEYRISIDTRRIYLYIPHLTEEVTQLLTNYNLTIYVENQTKRIILGSYRLSVLDSIASSKSVSHKGIEYQEYVPIDIPDVASLTDIIDTSSNILHIELTPIKLSNDYWIACEDTTSGYTSLVLDEYVDNIEYRLSINPPWISASLFWTSKQYSYDYERISSLIEYMRTVYGIDINGCKSRYELVIKDNNSIFSKHEYTSDYLTTGTNHHREDLGVCWRDYRPGLSLRGRYSLLKEGDTEIFSIMSDEIPLTIDRYRALVNVSTEYIDLNSIDMNNISIDAVNKVVHNIVNISKPDNYKANILKPIFVHTYDLDSIRIHPQIDESICINLNAYKSKVDTFYLRVEGVDFIEMGRTSAGVVFKVTGSNLPNKVTSGVFYILNEDKELVTTGPFNYEQ